MSIVCMISGMSIYFIYYFYLLSSVDTGIKFNKKNKTSKKYITSRSKIVI